MQFHKPLSPLFVILFVSPFLFSQINFGGADQLSISDPIAMAAVPGLNHSAPLNGTVQQFDGTPAKDVRVQVVERLSGQLVGSAFTDASGAFHMTSVPSGNYEIVAQAGLNEAREQITVRGVDSDVSLRLSAPDGNANANAGGRNSVSVAQIRVPQEARKLFAKAQQSVQRNRSDEARKLLGAALVKYPRYADAVTLQAILDMGENRLSDASAELEQALQYDPNYAMAYIAMGSCLNAQSQFDGAIRTLDEGLRLDPTSWQAHFEMGKALTAKAEYKKALGELAKAENAAPRFPAIHLVRGYALIGLGQYPNAIGELEAYVQAEPGAPTVPKAKLTLEKIKALAASATGNLAVNALR